MKHQVGLLYFLCRGGAQPLSYFSRKTEEERQGGNTIIKLAFLRAEKKGGERGGGNNSQPTGGKGKRGVVAPEKGEDKILTFSNSRGRLWGAS